MEKREIPVDAMRLVGMLLVIWFHIGELQWGAARFFPVSLEEMMRSWEKLDWSYVYISQLLGDHAVPLFMFIAGYGLGLTLPIGTEEWWGKRLGKILWPFWLSAIFLAPLTWYAWQTFPEMMRDTVAQPVTIWRWLASMALLQNWSRATFNSPVAAWWFVPLIIQLYFVYPSLRKLLLSVSKKNFIKILLIAGGIWNLLTFLLLAHWPNWYFLWFSGFNYVMVLGWGLWWAHYRMQLPGMVGIGLWFIGWMLRLLSGELLFFGEVLIGWGWFVMLYGLFKPYEETSLIRMFSWLGRKFSYLVYLWHQPILYWLCGWLWWR